MKTTKKQLRRIIREAIKGSPAAGPNTGRPYIDVVMDALSSGDTDTAAQAVLSSYHMDDTWVSEEEALEDQLAALGMTPSQEDVEATAAAWLDGYRSGKFKPTEDQYKDQWTRGAERARARSKRNAPAWDEWRQAQGLTREAKKISLSQLRSIIHESSAGDPTQEILQWAEEGNRVTVAGKNIWPGLGNRSGLHSYADELIHDKWEKSSLRFRKNIEKLPPGTEVELKRYQGTSRGKGKWVLARVVTIATSASSGNVSQPPRKRMQEIYETLGFMYDRNIGASHVGSVGEYSDFDAPFNGINWKVSMKDGKEFIFPSSDPGRGDYAEWEGKHGEGFWETFMAY